MNQSQRPTLDTVAHAVGVSRTTVSNAYNRPDQLSPGLRDRILFEAHRLGYPGPNPVARGLATRRSTAVALLLPGGLARAFSDPALTVVLDALATTVDGHDHALILLPGTNGAPRPERITRVSADVAIAYGLPDNVPAMEAIAQRALPLLVIDSPAVGPAIRLGVDDLGGAAQAAAHLLSLGHRCVGILSFDLCPDGTSGPVTPERQEIARYRVTRERLTGYLQTLAGAGLDPAAVPIWEASGDPRETGAEGVRWLLNRTPPPTALLCTSDGLGAVAVRTATELGLSVPEDLSVVGYDDSQLALHSTPPLTTVHQPLDEKGRRAGELTLALLEARDTPTSPVQLPTHLVHRGSTAPAA